MYNTVGAKGQVVIEKAIREALGVEAGYITVQRLVEGHVEIHFFPPEHRDSLLGVLAPHVKRSVSPEEWRQAVEDSYAEAAREEWESRSTQKLNRQEE